MSTETALKEDVMRTVKKTRRALNRLCKLGKRAGRERQMKAFESFCRAFAETKTYTITFLLVAELNAARIMELRSELGRFMVMFLRFRSHLAPMYERETDKGIMKVDRMMERKSNKTHRLLLDDQSLYDDYLQQRTRDDENDDCLSTSSD